MKNAWLNLSTVAEKKAHNKLLKMSWSLKTYFKDYEDDIRWIVKYLFDLY